MPSHAEGPKQHASPNKKALTLGERAAATFVSLTEHCCLFPHTTSS